MMKERSVAKPRSPDTAGERPSEDAATWADRLPLAFPIVAAAHPGIVLGENEFLSFLFSRQIPIAHPLTDSATAQLADLYLVCAVLRGNQPAAAKLDRMIVDESSRCISRLRMSSSLHAELSQLARTKLLFSESSQTQPKLAQFSGTGPLGAWLRIVITRELLMLKRRTRRSEPSESLASTLLAEEPDLEIKYFKLRYAKDFQVCFTNALESLSVQEKNLLRHQVRYGMGIDQIGKLYHVSRATAARWLASTRQKLLDETVTCLVAKLGISRSEVQSIIRLVSSQLDVSISRLLGRAEEVDSS